MTPQDPRCACKHEQSWHYSLEGQPQGGACDVYGCKCRRFVKATAKPIDPPN